jgi:hypothetical protein
MAMVAGQAAEAAGGRRMRSGLFLMRECGIQVSPQGIPVNQIGEFRTYRHDPNDLVM